MKRSIKRELCVAIESDYINGKSNLEVIGMRFGVSKAYVALIGREMFPGWAEICRQKKSSAMREHWIRLKELDMMMSRYDGCCTDNGKLVFALPRPRSPI